MPTPPKKYNKVKAIKALAREQVGQPKRTRYIVPKRDKKKHQEDIYNDWLRMSLNSLVF